MTDPVNPMKDLRESWLTLSMEELLFVEEVVFERKEVKVLSVYFFLEKHPAAAF